MPRGQHLDRARLPKEERLRLLNREPLEPDEVSVSIRVRIKKDRLPAVLGMSAKERGVLLARGVQDAKTDE